MEIVATASVKVVDAQDTRRHAQQWMPRRVSQDRDLRDDSTDVQRFIWRRVSEVRISFPSSTVNKRTHNTGHVA